MKHRSCLLWNDATQCYVPAPATACRRGKSRNALAPITLLLGALLAAPAGAQTLPTGGKVMSGQASIGQNGSKMTIDQASPKAIVHWQGFDIGKGAKVQFNQSSASAVALNRVVAGSASQIHGQLSANGQVWLVNPNGVVFGQGSQVNVGGLVASTLDTTNEDFNAGRQVFTRCAAQGGITNHGDITVADGGTLALLAPTVKNEGTLTARLGNVVLAGGDQVTLQAGADGRLQVGVDPTTVRTLIENQRLIVADGGQVVMTASAADALAGSVVSNTGTVQAQTLERKYGRIVLRADMQHGQVLHSGLLDASAPKEGNGGVVGTQAAQVQIQDGAQVTTDAVEQDVGVWCSTTAGDLTISAGRAPVATNGIGADTLAANLDNTNITLRTVAAGDQQGSIHVNADIAYQRNTLTLSAARDIHVPAKLSVNDTAKLRLDHGGAAPAADSRLIVSGQVDFAHEGRGLLSINNEDYIVIKRLEALQNIGSHLDENYALGRSIDATETLRWNDGKGFAPIGSGARPFESIFDGLGHSIRGLTIQRPAQDDVGLFGHATNAGLGHTISNLSINRPNSSSAGLFGSAANATLRNLKLKDVNVKGADQVGALVGYSVADGGLASVSNVHSSGEVSGSDSVGGLVGQIFARGGGTASLFNVHTQGSVRGRSDVGGLVGNNFSVTNSKADIDNASSTTRVTGRLENIGGLVGHNGSASGSRADISKHMPLGR